MKAFVATLLTTLALAKEVELKTTVAAPVPKKVATEALKKIEAETHTKDALKVEEVYEEADKKVKVTAPHDGTTEFEAGKLYEHECEEAIGHDGHYDETTGEWMLDDDYDAEPEWRCLMRPFLRYGVKRVEDAELSIEAKTVVAEKKKLITVHERLVKEADLKLREEQCMSEVEVHMAALEECELRVLRTYAEKSTPAKHDYPSQWETLLEAKKKCVDKFAEDAQDCRWVWQPQWDRYYKDASVEMTTIE